MRLLRARNGQSMAEYAILFAIVIGAAIAMQQYIKSRLQGAMQGASEDYITKVSARGGFAVAPFEPNRTTVGDSSQSTKLSMTSSTVGDVNVDTLAPSISESTVTK